MIDPIHGKGAPKKHQTSDAALATLDINLPLDLSDTKLARALWDDPAMIVGLAVQFGRICRANGDMFPECVRELLCDQVLKGDLASEMVLCWLFSLGIVTA